MPLDNPFYSAEQQGPYERLPPEAQAVARGIVSFIDSPDLYNALQQV